MSELIKSTRGTVRRALLAGLLLRPSAAGIVGQRQARHEAEGKKHQRNR